MPEIDADILILGAGLGATAAARMLALAGRDVLMVPGVGRSRGTASDGGVVEMAHVQRAFAGQPSVGVDVKSEQMLAFDGEEIRLLADRLRSPRQSFRRAELESWAQERAEAAGVRILHDFNEGGALVRRGAVLSVPEEQGDRVIRGRTIVITEGGDPRIATSLGLRPDYPPDQMIHFARCLVRRGAIPTIVRRVTWRTSKNMPVGVIITPQLEGVIVAVQTPLINEIRSHQSATNALEEFLSSSLADALHLDGYREDVGVELVAFRSRTDGLAFARNRVLLGIDAAGVIDPRDANRFDWTIRSGLLLGETLLGNPDAWDEVARQRVGEHLDHLNPARLSRKTGYYEFDGVDKESVAGRIRRLFGR